MKSKQLFAVAAVAAAATAAAQEPRRPDPANPAAAAPAVRYQSPFEGYRSLADDKPADWRQSNDEAGRLGGHAGQVPGSVPPRPAAQSAAPAGKAPANGERK